MADRVLLVDGEPGYLLISDASEEVIVPTNRMIARPGGQLVFQRYGTTVIQEAGAKSYYLIDGT